MVKHGASKLNDLSFRSNVPEGKIYSIMSSLEKRGAVIKSGKRPQKYDAQNPRHVLENEQNQLMEKCRKSLESSEQSWEIRNEKIEETEKTWQVVGISSILGEMRRLLETRLHSIISSVPDLNWLTSKDISRIQKCLNNEGNVKIITSTALKPYIYHRMLDAKINVKVSSELPMNFCIFNHKTVLWIIGNYEAATIINDKNLANLLIIEFEKTLTTEFVSGDEIIVA